MNVPSSLSKCTPPRTAASSRLAMPPARVYARVSWCNSYSISCPLFRSLAPLGSLVSPSAARARPEAPQIQVHTAPFRGLRRVAGNCSGVRKACDPPTENGVAASRSRSIGTRVRGNARLTGARSPKVLANRALDLCLTLSLQLYMLVHHVGEAGDDELKVVPLP